MSPLILASTSIYRKNLLNRLGIEFITKAPLFDEESAKNAALTPQTMAEFLAMEKAKSLASDNNCVIGADQLVHCDGKILGKSKSHEKALMQLQSMSGKIHEIITAVCIVHHNKLIIPFCNITKMHMKKLSTQQLERYILLDQPVDCAGSYKIELHGIRLFEKIESTDFTAIEGLPLIQLSLELEKLGYQL
jgi:septum formation protein